MKNGEDWTEETALAAEQAIGYAFRDRALLRACFTHKSYTNHCGEPNNERLEFLGDAVIGFCVTQEIFRRRDLSEGELTELRKQYVSKEALTKAAARAGLMRFLRYSGAENNVGGKTASNLFEAVAAGIFLDGGLEETEAFLRRFLRETENENYKNVLQEFTQEREKKTPVYKVREEGDGFVCTVTALGHSATGEGESKKSAETQAAKQLCAILKVRK